jgi:hypothetical protein
VLDVIDLNNHNAINHIDFSTVFGAAIGQEPDHRNRTFNDVIFS